MEGIFLSGILKCNYAHKVIYFCMVHYKLVKLVHNAQVDQLLLTHMDRIKAKLRQLYMAYNIQDGKIHCIDVFHKSKSLYKFSSINAFHLDHTFLSS
jgi:hypothetical protein